MISERTLPLFAWQPTTEVIPFPLTRRPGFARRHAEHMLGLTAGAADRYLLRQIQIQRDVLERRGVASDRITAELRALETQIRCECSRVLAAPMMR